METYLFDTKTFRTLLGDGDMLKRLEGKAQFYATPIQHDEIARIPDPDRRERALRTIEQIPFQQGADRSSAINESLNQRKKTYKNVHDSIIAEICLERGFTMVSDNQAIRELVAEHKGKAVSSSELLSRFSGDDWGA